MKTLKSYVAGAWHESGARTMLVNPATEEALAEAAGGGVDWKEALAQARRAGGAFRQLTFADRGQLLKAFSKLIHGHRDELIALAVANGGNTRSDAKFDIDGAAGTLAAYAELGAQIGAVKFLTDGEGIQLT